MNLYIDAALELNILNDEQISFIEDIWSKDDNLSVHLTGAAGTGKTFIALHCVLEFLTSSDSSNLVLFVCQTTSLSLHFCRWLLVRLKRSPRLHNSILNRIRFLACGKRENQSFRIKLSKNGDLYDVAVKIPKDADFGIAIFDESHHAFCKSTVLSQEYKILLQCLLSEEHGCKCLLLSDSSQAYSTSSSVRIPSVNNEFSLKTSADL